MKLGIAGWIPTHAVVKVTGHYRHLPMVLWRLCGWYEGDRLVTTADQAGTTGLRGTFEGLTFLPYLCGSTMPKYNPDARGAFYGLTMEHTRGHAVRSIMEAVSCMLKSNLDYMGVECNEIQIGRGDSVCNLDGQRRKCCIQAGG